jgi:hypothetical protein
MRSSNEPTPEFARHHTVGAPKVNAQHFRTAWRTRPRVELLLRHRAISARKYDAADLFRRQIEHGFGDLLSAADIERAGGKGGRIADPALRLETRRNTVARLRQVEARLGTATYRLLVEVLVNDVTWFALGAQMGCCAKTARTRSITAIRRLAMV